MKNFSEKRARVKFRRFFRKLASLDWTDPLNLCLLAAIFVLPFVAKIYFMTGLLLGLLLAITILFLLRKSSARVRRLVKKYPVFFDIVLSSLALLTIGSFFGSGLVLAIGAVCCGLILSWSLPNIKVEPALKVV